MHKNGYRLAVLLFTATRYANSRHLLASSDYCAAGETGAPSSFADPVYPWAMPRDEQEWYCKNVELFASERDNATADNKQLQFVIYGDSIMQCLRWAGEFCKTTPQWFERGWGAKYNALSWALGSETSSTLFWRMLNGNTFKGTGTKAVLLYIGSNDFGQADQDEEGQVAEADVLIDRVKQISQWIMDQDPNVVVFTLALLPMTGYKRDGSITGKLDPVRQKGTEKYNEMLKEYGWAEKRVRFIDCCYPFLRNDGVTIRKELMEDGLHPNEAGFKKLAACIDPFLLEHVGKGNDGREAIATNSVGRK